MLAIAAACLILLPGPVTEKFAPGDDYSGHWGVDVAVPSGSMVVAPMDGVVSFAGLVAGVKSVTIRRGPFRVSLSYLDAVHTEVGRLVTRGNVVGVAGAPHGRPGLHVGVRRGHSYVDPVLYARCGAPGGTLRLLPPMLSSLIPKD